MSNLLRIEMGGVMLAALLTGLVALGCDHPTAASPAPPAEVVRQPAAPTDSDAAERVSASVSTVQEADIALASATENVAQAAAESPARPLVKNPASTRAPADRGPTRPGDAQKITFDDLNLGMSQRGEPIVGLLATRAAGTEPVNLDNSGRPTVVLVGQQHGDEPAGSEALLVISRELVQGLLEPLLDRINVVVVPRANPDGAAAGTRVTANGVDMNRDHLLLQTPEARALAKVVNDYRPILVVDAHEYTVVGRYLQKFNAIQRYDALLQYTTTANYPEFLTKASHEWYHLPMTAALKAQGLTSDWYYTTSTNPDDKRISMGGTQPDTGRNVNGLKNAVSLLIETRGVGIGRMHIQRRVHSQVTAITSALRTTAERAANLEQVRSFVVRDVSAQACRDQVVVEAAATPTQRELDFLDPETGADKLIRVEWNSSLTLQAVKTRARPCGYWLSANSTAAVERLRLLGLQVMRVAEPGSALADIYRETARESGNRQDVIGTIAGGAGIVRVQVSPVRSAIDVPAGSFYVPLNQPRANLAVAALEPDTQNSYFANYLIQDLTQAARVMAPPSLVFEETN